jgi:hypothetical protein
VPPFVHPVTVSSKVSTALLKCSTLKWAYL